MERTEEREGAIVEGDGEADELADGSGTDEHTRLQE